MPREVIELALRLCWVLLAVCFVVLAALFLAADEIHWTWGF